MLTLDAPSVIIGDLLARQLADAGLPTLTALNGDVLELSDLTESDRAAAQAVVDAHPPTAQAEAQRMAGEQANAATIRDQAAQALDVNRTYIARTSPTAAQTTAQVKALSRQNNALIRLLLNRFDGTD